LLVHLDAPFRRVLTQNRSYKGEIMIPSRSSIRLLVPVGVAAVFVALVAFAQFAVSQENSTKDPAASRSSGVTQATMRGIFTALTTSYTYSLDMDYFQDRHNRDAVIASLEALVANTSALEEHGGGLDPSFDYLRRFLAGDAEEALKRYQERQYFGTQFMLVKLMENCATCHSRLPSDQAFGTGAQFLKDARVGAMGPVDRVNIEIAARQFDKALSTYEEIFALPSMTSQGLQLIGAFEGYLKIAIGVRNDTARPSRTLENFLRREDVPAGLREVVQTWIKDLAALDLKAGTAAPFKTARELVGYAAVIRKPTSARPELVHMVAANTLLHRYLQTLSTYDSEASEVFYLLAVTESYVSRSYWIAETDFLLEKAVRSAPKSDFARKAFAVLADRSAVTAPPSAYEDMKVPKVDLEELRKLVEG
jgi:hypothetical protein